jgi:hypothetical protein
MLCPFTGTLRILVLIVEDRPDGGLALEEFGSAVQGVRERMAQTVELVFGHGFYEVGVVWDGVGVREIDDFVGIVAV